MAAYGHLEVQCSLDTIALDDVHDVQYDYKQLQGIRIIMHAY